MAIIVSTISSLIRFNPTTIHRITAAECRVGYT